MAFCTYVRAAKVNIDLDDGALSIAVIIPSERSLGWVGGFKGNAGGALQGKPGGSPAN
jgi:hypothetical protein